MGNIFRFPVVHAPSSYIPNDACTPAGEQSENDIFTTTRIETDVFSKLAENFLAPVLEERENVLAARNKLNIGEEFSFDKKEVNPRFQEYSAERLAELKAEFQLFDVNKDGLIDFLDLCRVLDEVGDNTPMNVREDLFIEVDEDESGAIDFEEFLHFMTALASKSDKMHQSDINTLFKQTLSCSTRLGVAQQISHGLF